MKSISAVALLFVVFNTMPNAAAAADQKARFAKFEKAMSGVRLTGFFTMAGRAVAPAKEEYNIISVKKVGDGDFWLFRARMGRKGRVIPMPLPVKWLGDTPVISMEKLTIPGLGTFSAHVVLDGDQYAGTWTHGSARGHLYGAIERVKQP